jgi:hypothetical protein
VTSRPARAQLLADRLALAILEHGPTAGAKLARLVATRDAEVRRVLERDPRFVRVGAGRGSRWHLTLPGPLALWDEMGRDSRAGSRSEDAVNGTERLGALERRLAEVERRLADREAPTA